MRRVRVRGDLLPPAASRVVGGPLGRRVSERSGSAAHLLPLIVALVSLPMAGAVLRQGHCIANGWNGNDQFWRGCFSDLPAQYQLAGYSEGIGAWLTGGTAGQEMPLVAAVMALLGGLVPQSDLLTQARWYMALWTVLTTVLVAVTVWCVGRLRPGRLDLATQVALSPIYLVAALLSGEILPVTLAVGAMLAYARRRWVAAGVLLGLALLASAWAWVLLPALLIAARRRGELGDAWRSCAVAVGGAALVVVLLLVVQSSVVTTPARSWWSDGAGYGSLLRLPELLGYPLPVWAVTAVALIGVAAAVVGAALFARSAWRPATWAQVAAFAVPVMLISGKSVPVQAGLVVAVLAILAGVSWRTHLGFVAVEAVHSFALWFHLGYADDINKGLPPAWYGVIVLARTIAWGFLLWSVWYTPVDNPDNRDNPDNPGTPDHAVATGDGDGAVGPPGHHDAAAGPVLAAPATRGGRHVRPHGS